MGRNHIPIHKSKTKRKRKTISINSNNTSKITEPAKNQTSKNKTPYPIIRLATQAEIKKTWSYSANMPAGNTITDTNILWKKTLRRKPDPKAIAYYMIRKFGWPNTGCDSYKDHLRWILTTPIKGVAIGIHSGGGSPASIGISTSIFNKIWNESQKGKYLKASDTINKKWWNTTGKKLYTFRTAPNNEKNEITTTVTHNIKTWEILGYAKRKPNEKGGTKIPARYTHTLRYIIEKYHKNEVQEPKFNWGKPQATPTEAKVINAMTDTLKKLTTPTHVDDYYFNILGDLGDIGPQNIDPKDTGPDYAECSGYSPKHWFTILKGKPKQRPQKS
jgi:hypothetical protein